MAYGANVIADSVSERGDRLTTLEVTFPRMVLAEFNTHRMLSRNSASSRAIPVETQLERIENDPFVPEYWGEKQKGMQAGRELSKAAIAAARAEWLGARDDAVKRARGMLALGLHKQLTNRILEPFMWQTVIVTATEWSNYFALRANPMAQPEIQKISYMMQDAMDKSTPNQLPEDEWHLPLIQSDERNGAFEYTEQAQHISAARCARVSYLTHDGRRDLSADAALYERLVSGGHMSPLEHPARPMNDAEFTDHEWSGNFHGWVQLRKMIPNEHDFSKVEKTIG